MQFTKNHVNKIQVNPTCRPPHWSRTSFLTSVSWSGPVIPSAINCEEGLNLQQNKTSLILRTQQHRNEFNI